MTSDTTLEQFDGPPRTAEIEALQGVDSVEAATFVFGGLLPLGGEPSEGGLLPQAGAKRLETLVFAGSNRFLGTDIIQGRNTDPESPGEFVASEGFMDVHGAEVGDRFTLITISQEQATTSGFDVPAPDGPTLDATLVGVFGGSSETQEGDPLVIFPTSLLDLGDVGVAATQSLVDLSDGTTVEEFRNQLDTLRAPDAFG